MVGLYVVLGVITLLLVLLALKGFKTVPQSMVVLIERFGKYNRTLNSGLHMILPLWDKPRRVVNTTSVSLDTRRIESQGPTGDIVGGAKVAGTSGQAVSKGQYYWSDFVDMREQILDFPAQSVITKDNLQISVDAILYYQITDPVKAVYEIENLPLAIERLTQTSLRTAIGAMELDETLDSRDAINLRLRSILDESTDKWGVKITRVELQDISPPADFREAMQRQITAERERRATVIEAEGSKEAAITKAEGEKIAAITKAEGHAKARLIKAEAEAAAIESIWDKLNEDTPNYLLVSGYIEAIKAAVSSPGSQKIFLPFDTIKTLGSLGGMAELMGKGQ